MTRVHIGHTYRIEDWTMASRHSISLCSGETLSSSPGRVSPVFLFITSCVYSVMNVSRVSATECTWQRGLFCLPANVYPGYSTTSMTWKSGDRASHVQVCHLSYGAKASFPLTDDTGSPIPRTRHVVWKFNFHAATRRGVSVLYLLSAEAQENYTSLRWSIRRMGQYT